MILFVGSQRKTRLVLWAHPGNDITGMMARSEKMVTTSEILMGGKEVYHYHTKFIMKEPFTGTERYINSYILTISLMLTY